MGPDSQTIPSGSCRTTSRPGGAFWRLGRKLRYAAAGAGALAITASFALGIAGAQTPASLSPGQAAIAHSAAIAPVIQILLGLTPSSIPQTLSYLDSTGQVGTYLPGGSVPTAGNPFFDTALTSNGRSCFTCHIPQGGWTISPPQINSFYISSSGKSPLFQPIDSANCPDAAGATAAAGSKFLAARTQLFNRGNFRISVNGPNPVGLIDSPSTYTTFEGNTPSAFNSSTAAPQWVLTVISDPTGCENDPTYGLPKNLVSVYRRTMPSANVFFLNPGGRGATLSNIMWDSREPSLENQFIDATEFHGQTTIPPTAAEQDEGAAFQAAVYAGQVVDNVAQSLTGSDGSGALGGPQNLYESRLSVPFKPFAGGCLDFLPDPAEDPCPGILDPGAVFGAGVGFDLYSAFASATSKIAAIAAQRKSIARGENIFNTRTFTI
ncbi:MAG: hypothetical protein ABSG46_05900, partial [Candidatus Binataceae bacterium]